MTPDQKKSQRAEKLRLVAHILETGCEWEAMGTSMKWFVPKRTSVEKAALVNNWKIRVKPVPVVLPPGEKWHNPEKVPLRKVGEGWRLLIEREVDDKNNPVGEWWDSNDGKWCKDDAPQGWRRDKWSTIRVPASTPFPPLPDDEWTVEDYVTKFFRALKTEEKFDRKGWTEDMLPAGWRPLLRGEKFYRDIDHIFLPHQNRWEHLNHSGVADNKVCFLRTQRPFPEPIPEGYVEYPLDKRDGSWVKDGKYWAGEWDDCGGGCYAYPNQNIIVPVKVKVLLGPLDVPPGSVVQGAGEEGTKGWCLITSCSETGIRLWSHCDDNAKELTWQQLMDHDAKIRRPNDADWQPCYKLV